MIYGYLWHHVRHVIYGRRRSFWEASGCPGASLGSSLLLWAGQVAWVWGFFWGQLQNSSVVGVSTGIGSWDYWKELELMIVAGLPSFAGWVFISVWRCLAFPVLSLWVLVVSDFSETFKQNPCSLSCKAQHLYLEDMQGKAHVMASKVGVLRLSIRSWVVNLTP